MNGGNRKKDETVYRKRSPWDHNDGVCLYQSSSSAEINLCLVLAPSSVMHNILADISYNDAMPLCGIAMGGNPFYPINPCMLMAAMYYGSCPKRD